MRSWFFIGPMVGAVTMTLINSMLSSYTELWMLYLGTMFVLTVMGRGQFARIIKIARKTPMSILTLNNVCKQ